MERVGIQLLGGPRDGAQVPALVDQAAGVVTAPAQLVLPRLDPPVPPGLAAALQLMARWAAGEECPFRLLLDVYNLHCDRETGEVAYVYGGEKTWDLARWRDVPGVNWQTSADPTWGMTE